MEKPKYIIQTHQQTPQTAEEIITDLEYIIKTIKYYSDREMNLTGLICPNTIHLSIKNIE